MSLRRRFFAAAMLAAVIGVSSALAGGPAFGGQRGARAATAAGARLCVGSGAGCFATIQGAVDTAHDGDTILIGAGTFAGGVTIDVSVKVVGSGSGATIISGGGPVLTIGVAGAASEPTVKIDGVTVTGGVTVGNLTPFNGRGGGIYIPRAAGPSTGATVTIRNSVIRGNSVAPLEATDSGDPCCPFADAGGGGISNDGNLTLDHTIISGNRSDAAGGLTSQAVGGGILDRRFGNLTLKSSVVSDNHAAVTPPNGQEADGGGIVMVAGTLTIVDSRISNNGADLVTSLPSGVETFGVGGGVHVQGDAVATIRSTSISGNSVTGVNLVGDAAAFSGGLHAEGPLVLLDSTVSDNSVAAIIPAGSTGAANADSGAGELNADATISNTHFTGNSVSATSPSGTAAVDAGAIATAAFDLMTISDSVISGNSVRATTSTGSATVRGGGMTNIGVLALRNTSVNTNTGTASGPSGVAQGGGIWNGVPVPNGPPLVQLTLVDSAITHNTLTANTGINVQGGGLFTPFPVTLKNTVIANNVPDQCFGC